MTALMIEDITPEQAEAIARLEAMADARPTKAATSCQFWYSHGAECTEDGECWCEDWYDMGGEG